MTSALRSSEFNLPFDISRLAVKHGSARGKAMRGGFTFKLPSKWWRPAIQVRRLNARASLMQLTHPPKRRDPRGHQERNIPPRQRRGSFIDSKTIAAALLSRSFNLASLADFLKTATRKTESGGHGKQLTERYLRYAIQDVQATWECYQVLRDRYALHALEETPMGKILSEASLGKAYLRQMGVRPFREVQLDFPAHLIGKILSAYFGRAEVRWRREIRQVLYCDFLSMYPTDSALRVFFQRPTAIRKVPLPRGASFLHHRERSLARATGALRSLEQRVETLRSLEQARGSSRRSSTRSHP